MATIIDMPKLSDTMSEGTLVAWMKKEGDRVEPGDMIAEIETDKATMELENFEEGYLLVQYAKEGEQVAIGSPICAIGEEGEEVPKVEQKSTPPASPAPTKTESEDLSTTSEDPSAETQSEAILPAPEIDTKPEEVEPAPPKSKTPGRKRIKISPLARNIATKHGVSIEAVKGTGPGGRIVKADVLKAVKGGAALTPSPVGTPDAAAKPEEPQPTVPSSVSPAPSEEKIIPVSKIRSIIAQRLLESKTQIPHFYLEMEIDAAPLLDLRAVLNNDLANLPPEAGGIKLSVNDFILKATAEALRRVPAVNASWTGETIVQYGSVHLAFAVAIEEGLVTPVIRDAQAKGLRQMSVEAKELAHKARNRKLTPDEMAGGTFTVSNLGMFGVTSFFGIINPPNAAILSVGATTRKPVVDKDDNIAVGQRMTLSLSCDHRTVDGTVGAQFLATLKGILETPALMLV